MDIKLFILNKMKYKEIICDTLFVYIVNHFLCLTDITIDYTYFNRCIIVDAYYTI